MKRTRLLPPQMMAMALLVMAGQSFAVDLLERDRYWERNPQAWGDDHAYEQAEHKIFADEHHWIRHSDKQAWREETEALLAQARDEYSATLASFETRYDDLLEQFEKATTVPRAARKTLTIYPRYSPGELAALTGDDHRMLDELVTALINKRDITITVTGHSNKLALSPRAAERYTDNKALSQARADAVAAYLAERLRLPSSQVSASGMGATRPLDSSDTARALARNRRVEIAVSYVDAGLVSGAPLEGVPGDFEPWWQPQVLSAFTGAGASREENIESLYLRALQHSTQVAVFRDVPLIRETAILEAEGDFDPELFIEAEFRDTDEPVGNTLRTGGPPRFKEQQISAEAGVRKKFSTGAQVELSQRLTNQQNNSVFFLPDDQALTRLRLSVTQPLLRGAGIAYNRSTVAIAKIDHSIAEDELQRQVESHLLEIARSYWSLYQERASYLISQRLASSSAVLLDKLRGRRGIDVIESQIATARAAYAQRRAELVRSAKAIRNAEARLITLVNDPELASSVDFELVPTFAPIPPRELMGLAEASRQALANRPEIDQAMKQLRAGMLRARISENEMLPELNLIAGMELNGLDGQDRVGGSFENQFDEGEPSYFVGLQMKYALGNRAAKARYQRRRIEVRQLSNQLRTTINSLMLETQISVRELHASAQELKARYAAMMAARKEVETLEGRRDLALTAAEQGSDFLARLLSAQEDLADSEQAFVSSRVTYSLANVNLDRAMGLLMQTQSVEAVREQPDNAPPQIRLGTP